MASARRLTGTHLGTVVARSTHVGHPGDTASSRGCTTTDNHLGGIMQPEPTAQLDVDRRSVARYVIIVLALGIPLLTAPSMTGLPERRLPSSYGSRWRWAQRAVPGGVSTTRCDLLCMRCPCRVMPRGL